MPRLSVALLASVFVAQAPFAHAVNDPLVEHGRYLAQIAACNDCHTPGYKERGGDVPEEQWLVGDPLGWRGPWGTSYASNLRLFVQDMTEEQWLEITTTVRYRPPMPWFNMHAMTQNDLRALYRYIRHLGPAGEAMPTALPPGEVPEGPYVLFPAPPK